MNIIKLIQDETKGRYIKPTIMVGPRDKRAGELIERIPELFLKARGRQPTIQEGILLLADNVMLRRAAMLAPEELDQFPVPEVYLTPVAQELLGSEAGSQELLDLFIDTLWWLVTIAAMPAEGQAPSLEVANDRGGSRGKTSKAGNKAGNTKSVH